MQKVSKNFKKDNFFNFIIQIAVAVLKKSEIKLLNTAVLGFVFFINVTN